MTVRPMRFLSDDPTPAAWSVEIRVSYTTNDPSGTGINRATACDVL